MLNVAIATTVTEIVPAANRGNAVLMIENQSDTLLRYAISDENIAGLTTSVGLELRPGDCVVIEGQRASRKISAINTGAGTKTVHWQLV